jgi:deazaflavin-dependent oxidoreductase (nitroreductase family)
MSVSEQYAPSSDSWIRQHVERYERSGGQDGGTFEGRRVVILTTRGARTGRLRKAPLLRVVHDSEYLVVASKGGAPVNPAWYHNLLADPQVELQDGDYKTARLARVLHDEERSLWWERALSVWPGYEEYQKRTTRLIPIVLLDAVR